MTGKDVEVYEAEVMEDKLTELELFEFTPDELVIDQPTPQGRIACIIPAAPAPMIAVRGR